MMSRLELVRLMPMMGKIENVTRSISVEAVAGRSLRICESRPSTNTVRESETEDWPPQQFHSGFENAPGHERSHFRATATDTAVAAENPEPRPGHSAVTAAGGPGAIDSPASPRNRQRRGPQGRRPGQAVHGLATTRRRRPEDGFRQHGE